MKRTFTNFSIEADFEIPVMYDNFKHSITVKKLYNMANQKKLFQQKNFLFQ